MIHLIGTNHKKASISDRERLVPTDVSLPEFLARARLELGASECVVLNTCYRFEIYFVGPTGTIAPRVLRRVFGENADSADLLPADSFYYRSGREVAEHLFTVACGLDSMILGEHEVLNQVKTALTEAMEAEYAGPLLARLFHYSLKTGKRARRETAISSGLFSTGKCAARLAQQSIGSLKGKNLLIIGAGEVAKVTTKHMAAQGMEPICIYSRTKESAERLAGSLGSTAAVISELPSALEAADVVLGCAATPHYVIRTAQVQEALGRRGGRPLVVVDLGVPRNVDPEVGQLSGVSLFNVDDLEMVVAENTAARAAEIDKVHAIITEELAEFQGHEARAGAVEIISHLRAHAEGVRQECLSLASKRQLPIEQQRLFDYLTDLLVRKLLHQPAVTLRAAFMEDPELAAKLADAAAQLFDLEAPEGGGPAKSKNDDLLENDDLISLLLSSVNEASK